jgi:hypothetical protein
MRKIVFWKMIGLSILPGTNLSRKGGSILIRKHLEGALQMLYQNHSLSFQELTSRSLKAKPKIKEKSKTKPKTKYMPPMNHPWRKYKKHLYHKAAKLI